MFRNNIFTILLYGSLCTSATVANAEVIFSDSFETGDMSGTNADGFQWDKNNRTSIVIQDPTNAPVKIWENGSTYEILSSTMPDDSAREFTPVHGEKSLRVRYRGKDDVSNPQLSEQRFDFGKGYPEIWFSYHIRVPLNYVRGPNGPSAGRNNKWMIFLMAPMSRYSNSDVSWVEVKDRPNSSNTGINIGLQIHNGANHSYTPESPSYANFVTPADAGRWMHIIFHLKASSDNNTSDGVVRMYRKWDDEPAFKYITGYANKDIGIGAGSVASNYLGWGAGYFMGWANDPYAEETEWLIDDFTVSSTSLLPNPPLPPSQVTGTVTPK